jgi:chromosome partitioning protein
MQGLAEAGINVFDTHINEREAFRAMFSFRQTLEGLRNEEVNNLDKAINNANAFTKEVVDRLRAIQYAQQEEVA